MRSTIAALFAAALFSGAAAGASESQTVIGCLQPGAAQGSFVLAVDGAQPVAVMSTKVGLTGHLGRQVSLVGRPGTFRGGSIFKVDKLAVVATSCG
jgi:hypothetical protein